MATHDYVIDNQTSANARADINNVLQAILSNNSSATAPTVTAANMFWYDTANNLLKMRNEADTDWIIVGYLDQSGTKFEVRTDVIQAASASGTSVKNSSGTTIINLSVASQQTAEVGTNNTYLMTPLRVSQAITALSPAVLSRAGFVGTIVSSYDNANVSAVTATITKPAGVTRMHFDIRAGAQNDSFSNSVSYTFNLPITLNNLPSSQLTITATAGGCSTSNTPQALTDSSISFNDGTARSIIRKNVPRGGTTTFNNITTGQTVTSDSTIYASTNPQLPYWTGVNGRYFFTDGGDEQDEEGYARGLIVYAY